MADKCLAYIVQARRGDEPILCIADIEGGKFHSFTLSASNVARLAAECSDVINTAMGGVSYKFAAQDLTLAWSRSIKAPSGDAK